MPEVHRETLLALLADIDLTIAGVARELDPPTSRQYLHRVIHGDESVSPRILRDLPLILASHTDGLSADVIRDAIFVMPAVEPAPSYLDRRLEGASHG